jgi:sarcosine oxidase delta subunit
VIITLGFIFLRNTQKDLLRNLSRTKSTCGKKIKVARVNLSNHFMVCTKLELLEESSPAIRWGSRFPKGVQTNKLKE